MESHEKHSRVYLESDGAGGLQEKSCASQGTDTNHSVVAKLNIFSVDLP